MKKQIHGGDVYRYENCLDFSASCNPLGTPEGVTAAMMESLSHVSDYPQVGYEPLKKALAAYEEVSPSQVICGNGAAELIFSLCQALKPKKALLAAPTFAEYEQALRAVDCELRFFMLKQEEGFVLGDGFLEALRPDTDVVFLCNPNNPTGLLIEKERLLQILQTCKKNRTRLVVDECFLDFVREPEKNTLKPWLTRFPELFLLKAFTKRYAMAGVRLGYGLCADEGLLERMTSVTQPWNLSVIAQAAGLAALKEQAYVEAGRSLVFEQAEILKAGIRRLGWKVYPSAANYIFFEGPEELFQRCVEKNLLIRDCGNFFGLNEGFYRVAVKRPEENQRLLNGLEEIAGELS